jgi:hypothetical protein
VQALHRRWFRRQVGYVHILQFYTYSLIVCEWP